MKKSVKIILGVAIVVLVVVLILVRIFVNVNNSDVSVEELPNTFEYVALEDLIAQYSLEEAKYDDVFVITHKRELYNRNNLEGFLKGVRGNKKSNLRIAVEEQFGIFDLMDVEYDAVTIKVSHRDGVSRIVTSNDYSVESGYRIVTKTVILNDGSEWNGCYVTNENTGDEIVLFGYVNLEAGKVEISGESL